MKKNIYYVARDLDGEGFLYVFNDENYYLTKSIGNAHVFNNIEDIKYLFDGWTDLSHYFEIITVIH